MREVGGDLDRDPAVDAVGGVEDRLEHVAGVADVGGGEREDGLVDVGARGGELTDLAVVALAVGEGGGEDRRVGGDPDDVVVLDEVGEVAALEALAGQVVEPDGDSGCGQVAAGGRSCLFLPVGGWYVVVRSAVSGAQPVATRMLSSAASATACAVIPNSR